MGGYIRAIGLHVCGLLLGMVVAFSWFATNQLGVGLHAYGAMEGAWMWLYLFWGFLALLMVVAGFISLRDKAKGSSKPDPLPDAAKAAV
jgi:hypothetical protein